ncbi:MAG TPA: patatin-like phospholipase family protein [Pyrinomonadaceae bacterium]
MKFRHRPTCFAAVLLAASLLASATASSQRRATSAGGRPQPEAFVIRVGVISYNSYASGRRQYSNELRAAAAAYKGENVVFQLAVGSYSDVLDWYNKELVDIAFLTPQPVAELRSSLGDEELSRRYLATHASNGGDGVTTPAFEYHSSCYVGKSTPIENVEQLREKARQGRLSFLFVDPLSLSGNIFPRHLLRELGVTNIADNPTDAGLNSATFTYGSKASIDMLAEAEEIESLFVEDREGEPLENFVEERKWPVAFFSAPARAPEGLKKIDFPALDTPKLPEEVVLATPSFLQHRDKLLRILRVDQPRAFFRSQPYDVSWLKRFDGVSKWVTDLGVKASDPHNRMFTLERIGRILRNYGAERQRPARLALVLSGGGAKCAYQIGAIAAIEAMVREDDTETEAAAEAVAEADGAKKESNIDIDLVVGTSGGAINALAVALGLTRDLPEIQLLEEDPLVKTWKGFEQKDFFSPMPAAYYLLALTTALLQAVLLAWLFVVVVIVGRLIGRDLTWLYRFVGPAMIALAAADALAQLSGARVDTRGGHFWQHVSLLFTFNLYLTAACLLVLGLLLTALLLRRENYLLWFRVTHTLMRNAFLFVVCALIAYSLFRAETLSRADTVESTLAKKLTALVSPKASARLAAGGEADTAQLFSKISNSDLKPMLQRDLVITGSVLDGGQAKAAGTHLHASLPPDIYFFHDKPKCGDEKGTPACDPDAPRDAQGLFRDFDPKNGRNYLLDVVIGSSSIYPIFPARKLADYGQIVDGGFAHNSPVEAAVMWKATHIILVEASPTPTTSESHLWQNAQNALNHLYIQAQLSDLRAHGKVEMFILRPEETPEEPWMCTFDFNSDSISHAIRRGYDDAGMGTKPRFERVHGEPVFELVDYRNTADAVDADNQCVCPEKPAANGEAVPNID